MVFVVGRFSFKWIVKNTGKMGLFQSTVISSRWFASTCFVITNDGHPSNDLPLPAHETRLKCAMNCCRIKWTIGTQFIDEVQLWKCAMSAGQIKGSIESSYKKAVNEFSIQRR